MYMSYSNHITKQAYPGEEFNLVIAEFKEYSPSNYINIKDQKGYTLLMRLCQLKSSLTSTIFNKELFIVEKLLKDGADPNIINFETGETAIGLTKNASLAKLLVRYHANVNLACKSFGSPLIASIYDIAEQLDMSNLGYLAKLSTLSQSIIPWYKYLNVLYKAGADINYVDKSGHGFIATLYQQFTLERYFKLALLYEPIVKYCPFVSQLYTQIVRKSSQEKISVEDYLMQKCLYAANHELANSNGRYPSKDVLSACTKQFISILESPENKEASSNSSVKSKCGKNIINEIKDYAWMLLFLAFPICSIGLVVGLVVWCGTSMYGCAKKDYQEWQTIKAEYRKKDFMWEKAKKYARLYLRAPHTATFQPGVCPDLVKECTDGTYEINAWVDSDNVFGGRSRMYFSIHLQANGEVITFYYW